MSKVHIIGIFTVLSITATDAAAVTVLPPSQWSSSTTTSSWGNSNSSTSSFPGVSSSSVTDMYGNNTASVTSSGFPSPSINAIATSTSVLPAHALGSAGVAQGFGDIQYSLKVLGPSNGSPISINAHAFGSAQSTAGAQAYSALWLYFYGGSGYQFYTQAVSNFGDPPASLNLNNSFTAYVGSEIFVEMQVGVSANTYLSANPYSTQLAYSSAQAYIDPWFSFTNPADASLYSFQLDPLTGNSAITPAVPEPSTWMMMLLGFCSLGLAGYSQKHKSRARTA